MLTCCASGCKSRYSRGKKLFRFREEKNAARLEVWLQRIGRTDLDPVPSRLCEDHFTADQFESILLRKFGTKELKRDAAPTIFSQEHLQTSGKPIALKNWRMFSPSSLFSASPIITLQPFTNLKHVLHIDAPSSSECDALPACSTTCSADGFVGSNYHMCAGVETTHESSCQPFQVLTVPVESQQNFCAACGRFLSAEGTADVTSKCSVLLLSHTMQYTLECSRSSSWDADQAVVAALHKRIATLEECLNNMKRKVATLQQQKSRANRRNHELTRNIKKYLSPDQLQGMWTSSMRGKQWSTETIQKGLKLRLACGSRGYNAVRELAVPLPSERTLQRRVENYKFSPGILHEVLKSLALKVKGWCS
ncbi:hypothetical protein HPB51_012688 [Rhipicephalus microplus]|uniref:THAP-type domain-containing protein n=1 Tax=Rhipicephalus microplus TaxID=6941 RepID=A0A9J6D4R8_RHIMP|nr:hypothetical protein HPB51_012688 [Rhipicephalus microplus]